MTKKILLLSGSFRKGGNSDLLCDEFMRGAREADNIVEKIRLSEKQINFCRGCGACNVTHKCNQNDDMAEILDKMVNADVIVMATPVYFYAMNGQMKTLIDRTIPRYTELANKEFYFIVTAADENPANLERVIEGFKGFAQDCLEGVKIKGIIYGTGVWQMGKIRNTPAMDKAYEMGKNC